MKKFVFIYCGFETPTPEVMEAWGLWFASLADKLIDNGNILTGGREISHSGTQELPLSLDSLTGYSVIRAENLDEAEKIAQECPITTSIKVYETLEL